MQKTDFEWTVKDISGPEIRQKKILTIQNIAWTLSFCIIMHNYSNLQSPALGQLCWLKQVLLTCFKLIWASAGKKTHLLMLPQKYQNFAVFCMRNVIYVYDCINLHEIDLFIIFDLKHATFCNLMPNYGKFANRGFPDVFKYVVNNERFWILYLLSRRVAPRHLAKSWKKITGKHNGIALAR